MKSFISSHIPIFLTIILALYGHLILKWQMREITDLPTDTPQKVLFLIKLLFTPWLLSAAIAIFCSGLAWMTAMTRFDLSYAYLCIGLLFCLIMVASILLFNEPVNPSKLIGGGLILVGIIVIGNGYQGGIS